MKIRVNEHHLLGIKRRLELLPVEFEHALCKKYAVSDLECLNATDYEEILETISDYIYKMRFDLFADIGNMVNHN